MWIDGLSYGTISVDASSYEITIKNETASTHEFRWTIVWEETGRNDTVLINRNVVNTGGHGGITIPANTTISSTNDASLNDATSLPIINTYLWDSVSSKWIDGSGVITSWYDSTANEIYIRNEFNVQIEARWTIIW
jgi:hypothetical protein